MRRSSAFWIALSVAVAAGPAPLSDAKPSSPSASRTEPVTCTGTALLLPDALKSTGLVVDTEPIAHQVVIKGDDGAIVPLLSDDASRALFADGRLRNHRTEVKGLRHPGSPYLQVVSFRVEHEGRLRTPEYYCEICTISVRYPQICPCCQGTMVLRMKPELN